MILGQDKKRVMSLEKDCLLLKEENSKLKEENKKMRDQAPNIDQLLKLLADLQTTGAGLVEIRRIHPDSFFLVSP